MISSRWWLSLAIHSWRRFLNAHMTRSVIAGGIAAISRRIVSMRAWKKWEKWMWQMPGFSRMEQRLIRRGDPCKFCGKYSRGSRSPCAVMSGGQRICLISLPAIASCGAISNQRCTHTDMKTFKPSRMLFARKSPLFPLQWPNESCEHSEVVSRSVSLMMATTLEISLLKHDDKNYFIYPFLCYNEIFFIF